MVSCAFWAMLFDICFLCLYVKDKTNYASQQTSLMCLLGMISESTFANLLMGLIQQLEMPHETLFFASSSLVSIWCVAVILYYHLCSKILRNLTHRSHYRVYIASIA
uniref:Uncharacterized protein n=1 Tax=Opuntia streptacantha TaxID=393608 RepID=A0A7C9D3L8_OPUST